MNVYIDFDVKDLKPAFFSIDDITVETCNDIYLKIGDGTYLFSDEDCLHLDFDEVSFSQEGSIISVRCKLDYAWFEQYGERIIFRDEEQINAILSIGQPGVIVPYVADIDEDEVQEKTSLKEMIIYVNGQKYCFNEKNGINIE